MVIYDNCMYVYVLHATFCGNVTFKEHNVQSGFCIVFDISTGNISMVQSGTLMASWQQSENEIFTCLRM